MSEPIILFQDYLPSAAVTATDSYSGSDPDSVLQAVEDTYWRPANTSGTKNLNIDLAQTLAVTAIGIVGEGLDGVVVSVYGDDNSSFSSPETLVDGVNLAAAVNCGWLLPISSTYRYYRFAFSNFGSAFRVAWICLCAPSLLPLFEEDPDLDSLELDGDPLVSPQGLFLGSNPQKIMSSISLNWGNVVSSDYTVIKAFRDACLRETKPFILVPDLDFDVACFGWCEGKFSAPFRQGMYRVEPLEMTTRAG